jgi:alcohol dehydrogenase class IV
MHKSDSLFWCSDLNNLEYLSDDKNLILGTKNSIKILSELIPKNVFQNSDVLTRVSGYPNVRELELLSSKSNCPRDFDNLICIGGGGTIDFGKLILSDLPKFGVIYNIPRIVLIPTNVGSGAEITRYSTLWNYESKLKTSVVLPENIRSEVYYIEAPLKSLSNMQIEIGTLDALAHSFDSLFSKKSDPLTRVTAKQNIQAICDILNSYYDNQISLTESLFDLQIYSCIGGLCINQTKSSVSHAFSYGLTLEFGIAHGYSVALMMQIAIKKYKHDLTQIYPGLLKTLEIIERTLIKASLDQKIPDFKFLISKNIDQLINQIDKVRLENFILNIESNKYKSFLMSQE